MMNGVGGVKGGGGRRGVLEPRASMGENARAPGQFAPTTLRSVTSPATTTMASPNLSSSVLNRLVPLTFVPPSVRRGLDSSQVIGIAGPGY
jgi:hypothetical protein